MEIPPKEIKTIAILRALQLGDLLCSIPAFRALREAYPTAKISLIGLPNSADLCRRFNAYLDDLIIFPGYHGLPEQTYNAESTKAFIEAMKIKKLDLILQMQGNGTFVNSLCTSLHPRYLAGFYPPDEEPDDSKLFMLYPNFGHEIDRHLLLLKHLGITSKNREMEFPISLDDEKQFKNLNLNFPAQSYVCMHPGSRNTLRQWPIAHFSAIGDFVSKQGYHVILTGTKEEIKITEKVSAQMLYPSINLAGKTSIGSLAVLLKNSAGLISNCTGVSHIAAAIKTPSVIISMDGEPERWGPKNRDLHHTLNWLENGSYTQAQMAVEKMLIPYRSGIINSKYV